jgi:formylmethanofuran dehydrogenase subunit E
MRSAYQTMADDELLDVEEVRLVRTVEEIVSRPGLRVPCARCGEEIMNEREVVLDGETVCRACAGDAYWERVTAS